MTAALVEASAKPQRTRCRVGWHLVDQLEYGWLDTAHPDRVFEAPSLREALEAGALPIRAAGGARYSIVVHREGAGDAAGWHTQDGASPDRWHSQQGSDYLRRHPEWSIDQLGWVIDPAQTIHAPRAFDHGSPLALFGPVFGVLTPNRPGCSALGGRCSDGRHDRCRFAVWSEHAPDRCPGDHPWRCGCTCHYQPPRITEPVQEALF